ncbi:MAG TPA: glycosyltransferase family 4 protein [Armatimonadetes bacterium]|jgi:glycosyltransferase involved in cell wall biosynthesis|nr:glycosyltransferase family 4 protein [Armatimonadota bacterium]
MGEGPLLRPVLPENTEFVILSFEGPDPYSNAGGLGVRVTELSRALADAGFRTHLFFIGDPEKPPIEAGGGRLILRRWGQWISRYYPNGVYQGEKQKLYDFHSSVPGVVADEVVAPARREGRTVVIMGEEWHTASTMCAISDLLHARGQRDQAVLLWNANHTMGFENIDFGRLNFTTTITTVSHYMKHTMWLWGINPIVLPNGIPNRLLDAPPAEEVRAIRTAVSGDPMLVKVGRWDPDKRWNMAVHAVAGLKKMGLRPRFVCRGGIEPYEGEVLQTARSLGLSTYDVPKPETQNLAGWCAALADAGDADIINLKFFVPEHLLRLLYAGADAVLANSGKEPFGIVGLEVMASGGIAVTGATGEEYARAFENAIVLETDDASEIVTSLAYLRERPEEVMRMRSQARITAADYTWARVVELLCKRIQLLSTSQNLSK